jgi:hypothetical protein
MGIGGWGLGFGTLWEATPVADQCGIGDRSCLPQRTQDQIKKGPPPEAVFQRRALRDTYQALPIPATPATLAQVVAQIQEVIFADFFGAYNSGTRSGDSQ